MKKLLVILSLAVFALVLCPISFPHAEAKPEDLEGMPAGTFPKLPTTPDDPILTDAYVYPFWGPICQRYTYSVIYKDEKGRPPEYVRIWFNGDWIDIEKENPNDNSYKKGVKYIYKYVPTKIGSNFYFFEASNGLGKARDGIIDSPDNGPVLFESPFDKNGVVLINASTGKKIWSYSTGKEWVGGVALSKDGKYLAAKTSNHVYLFETASNEPKWVYTSGVGGIIGGDVKGGIAISADGGKIFASIGSRAFLFGRDSNQPLWEASSNNSCYNAAISADGQYAAVACAGEESDPNTNLLILWSVGSEQSLWQYHSSGNFHDVSLSSDGSFIAAATGCPDRRAYLFSKDSNEPLWRSEMLTKDSPIHQANISADGSVAAFGAESSGGSVYLFSKASNKIVWKFVPSSDSSFRALGMTPSGKFIGGATLGGGAYIFGKDSKVPLAHWKISTNLGAMDIADSGSFIAVGGTDNKVRILERKTQKERGAVTLNEHVGEIDISGNGKYIVAGTAGSVYFFETLNTEGKGVDKCAEIIEPASMPGGLDGEEGEEDWDFLGLLETVSGTVFGVSLLALIVYLLLARFKRIRVKRLFIIVLGSITGISLIIFGVMVVPDLIARFSGGEGSEVPADQGSGSTDSDDSSGDKAPLDEEPVCGNNICEPDKGETKANCAKDCTLGSD